MDPRDQNTCQDGCEQPEAQRSTSIEYREYELNIVRKFNNGIHCNWRPTSLVLPDATVNLPRRAIRTTFRQMTRVLTRCPAPSLKDHPR